MRARRSGVIVNISSIGGFTGTPGFSYYNGAKFAVEGFSESLIREVGPLGIKVYVVEPAAMRTNFRGSPVALVENVIEDYNDITGNVRTSWKAGHGSQTGDPDKAAKAVVLAVHSGSPLFRLPLGSEAFRRIREKLAFIGSELKAWEAVGSDIEYSEKS